MLMCPLLSKVIPFRIYLVNAKYYYASLYFIFAGSLNTYEVFDEA